MAIINRQIKTTDTSNNFDKAENKLKYLCAEDKQDIF